MEKLYYKTQRNYSPGEQSFEKGSTEPSQTVPGQSRSIKELLQRALQGVPAPERQLNYFDPEDVDNVDEYWAPGLDLTDLDDLRRRNDQAAKAIKRAEDNKAKAEAEAKKKAESSPEETKPLVTPGAAPTDPKS